MNIYNIPASRPYMMDLVNGIISRFGDNITNLKNLVVFLPTKKACKLFDEVFIQQIPDYVSFIPYTIPLAEINEFDHIFSKNGKNFSNKLNLKILSNNEQKFLLISILKKHQKPHNIYQNLSTLCDSLVDIINLFRREDVPFSKLDEIQVENSSEYWQSSLELLKTTLVNYENILAKMNVIDKQGFMNIYVKNLAKYWQQNEKILIIAGSTGSINSTRNLIKLIISNPKNYLILPSIDLDADKNYWNKIDIFHPQYILKNLITFLKVQRKDIKNWTNNSYKFNFAINEIFKPAELSHIPPKNDNISLNNIKYISAFNLNQEAEIISLIIKNKIDKKENICVVTDNKNLTIAIKNHLKTWKISANTLEDNLLINSNKIKILLLANAVVISNFGPYEVLSFLKSFSNMLNLSNKYFLSKIEIEFFRKKKIKTDFNSIFKELEKDSTLQNWFKEIKKQCEDFFILEKNQKYYFKDILIKQIKFIENIENIYDKEDGKELFIFLTELLSLATFIGKVNITEYNEIFVDLIKDIKYSRQNFIQHKIKILSSIEARYSNYQNYILADFNENSWPKKFNHNCWLSKNMLKQLGLKNDDINLSLMAHDFFKLSQIGKTYITRSTINNGTITIKSRWLEKFLLLARYWQKLDQIDQTNFWLNIINKKCSANIITTVESPSPPLEIRPLEYTVSQIDDLINNPYRFYAKKILNLKILEPILLDPQNKDFGNLVHSILDIYCKNHNKIYDKEKFIFTLTLQHLEKYNEHFIYNFWSNYLKKLTPWIINYMDGICKNHQVISEIEGKFSLIIDNLTITIKCKADQIIFNNNSFEIIDFKTGSLPTNAEISNFIKPQLLIETLIANHSGFANTGDTSNLEKKASYISLKTYNTNPITKSIILDDEILNKSYLFIKDLLKEYLINKKAYNISTKNNFNNDQYSHLSRIKEWQ